MLARAHGLVTGRRDTGSTPGEQPPPLQPRPCPERYQSGAVEDEVQFCLSLLLTGTCTDGEGCCFAHTEVERQLWHKLWQQQKRWR
jgi:hypothetical protein